MALSVEVDAVTFIIGTSQTTLRQSSSAGARIDLSSLWIMSSHEARTDANQCSPGVSMAFSRRPSVPLLITNIAADSCGSDVLPCHARREPYFE
ncbi:hypothetical protein T12_14605 [Trichinella patagoniensis]|uniref:Uncharacterized protein n=1 Tax=Trichinella patagoniensis TaxID=990121 RepID=A0A0V1AG42_9BILA|nr:hypothetical protein T12_14605 [Trichinella patagoniensis]